jgi:hypothetical protein
MSTSRRKFLQGVTGATALAATGGVLPGTVAPASAAEPSSGAPDLSHLGALETVSSTSSLEASALSKGFRTPPAVALPRVWWHWMNQNITKEGIKADLDWFHRIGVGGFVNFDGAGTVPVVVPKPLPYMSDGWKDAFRYAMQRADELDLEADVAGSPGWSESGGPWVAPEDGMKKFVWTETWVRGGRAVTATLPQPPDVAGTFQDQAATSATPTPLPRLYSDARVFAYPVDGSAGSQAALKPRIYGSGSLATPTSQVTSNGFEGVALDAAKLSDPSVADPVHLPATSAATPTWVRFEYDKPITVNGLSIAAGGSFSGWNDIVETGPVAQVHSSHNGKDWDLLAEGIYNGVQRTLFVPATSARHFKVVFLPDPATTSTAPLAVAALILRTTPTVHQFEVKAGFGQTANYYAIDTPTLGTMKAVPRSEVVDLTGKMDKHGVLRWSAPSGNWVVVRLGFSLTGHQNGPASTAATGLEVDKFDAKRVRAYMKTYLDMLEDAAGEGLLGSRGLTGMLNDSYEAGYQNWTEDILAEFRRRRSYDPGPYLPALTGTVVGDAAESDKFLWDWRRTLNELLAENHYQVVTQEAHRRGLQRTYAEAQEDRRGWFGDDMEMRQYADIPMGASGGAFAPGDGPYETYRVDSRGAASVAHVFGRQYAAAESFTFTPQGCTPKDLKPTADLLLAQGINRFMIHTSAHQPLDQGPGITLNGIGSFFTRLETWAEQAKPWTTYLGRCCHVLSQGRHVADVAYFYGQEAPITGVWGRSAKQDDQPVGYDYDFVNGTVILNELSVKDGRLVSRGGASYRLLHLGGSSTRVTLPVLRKIASFVEDGIAVAGIRPTSSPSLSDDDTEFQRLAAKLWGDGTERDRVVGAGRVFNGVTAAEALQQCGIAADWSYVLQQVDPLLFTHRSTADADVYYVVNRRNVHTTLDVSLRAAGKSVELWDPVSGSVSPASFTTAGGRTALTIDLDPADSVFVVVTRGNPGSATVPAPQRRQIGSVEGSWSVGFQEDKGAPKSTNLPFLESLTDNADPGIKYFSGTATYSTTATVAQDWLEKGTRILLDLGEVHDIAEVKINGAAAGSVWRAPYRVDVTDAVRKGANTLEVSVTNSWFNREVGDAQPGAEKIAHFEPASRVGVTASTPLLPSGLMGPVRFYQQK